MRHDALRRYVSHGDSSGLAFARVEQVSLRNVARDPNWKRKSWTLQRKLRRGATGTIAAVSSRRNLPLIRKK